MQSYLHNRTWWGIVLLAACAASITGQAQDQDSAAELPLVPGPHITADQDSEKPSRAQRLFRIQDASWRFELTGAGGLPADSSRGARGGDIMFTGTVDYEIPFMAHGALGPRLMPVFVYDQHRENTVVGGGGGLAFRCYHVKNEQRGFFLEGEALVLGHYHRFRADSSHVDFITGGGVGYKCKAGWHAIVKFEHISNAGLGKDNAGINLIGVGTGWSFRPGRNSGGSGERLAKAQGGHGQQRHAHASQNRTLHP